MSAKPFRVGSCVGSCLAGALAAAALFRTSPACAADEKFALGMFHFNVQYVAGGMVGYYAEPNPVIDRDAEQVEDQIITESFAPVLELYAKHPSWAVDIEMQGYLLDVLAARHAETLDLLRMLAQTGQIEIASFHYSDQLFIAHPRDDWSRSQDLTAATFAKYGVPLGKSVFCQEGQAGTVMAREMKARGYATMVWPKNLWIYQHGNFEPDPLYQFGDISLVVGARDVSYVNGSSEVHMTWTFFDDGELLATGDHNPYFPDVFSKNDEALAQYETKLSDLEAQGYAITTVQKYVSAVSKIATPSELPPLLDGTWQPNSTNGVFRWLGGGGLWGADERDNDVRSLASIAHRELLAAETIAASAGLDAAAPIADAWRLLALGEVSDASGINPFRGEAEYGIAHMTEALRVARDVIHDAKEMLGKEAISIDPASASISDEPIESFRGEATVAPMMLTIDGADREVTEAWEQVRPGLTRVEITFGAAESRFVSVRFPGAPGSAIETTLALDDETPVAFDRKGFAFDHFYLALPIGMVGLGEGRYLIEDQAYVHLAAQIFGDSGDVVIEDQTSTVGEAATWVFYVLEGSAEEAVSLARSINDRRAVSR